MRAARGRTIVHGKRIRRFEVFGRRPIQDCVADQRPLAYSARFAKRRVSPSATWEPASPDPSPGSTTARPAIDGWTWVSSVPGRRRAEPIRSEPFAAFCVLRHDRHGRRDSPGQRRGGRASRTGIDQRCPAQASSGAFIPRWAPFHAVRRSAAFQRARLPQQRTCEWN